MAEENRLEIQGESADRQFHVAIAECTGNSALVAVIDDLWEIRETSPMVINLMEKARSKGVKPVVDEHRRIVASPAQARSGCCPRDDAGPHHPRGWMRLLQGQPKLKPCNACRPRIAARRNRFRRPI